MKKTIELLLVFMFVGVSAAIAATGLLESGTYSVASTNTGVVTRAGNDSRLTIEIIPTAVSGVPSVVNTIQGLDSAGNAYTLCASSAITAAASAVQVIHIGPGLAASAVGAVGGTCVAPVPDKWRVNVANGAVSGVENALTQSIYYNTSP